MGKLLFGKTPSGKAKWNITTPDIMTEGVLKKRWMIAENVRVLIKGSSQRFRQEPYNEVIAFKIAESLGIGHVQYTLLPNAKKNPYSKCPCFITPNTELVTAAKIMGDIKEYEDVPTYEQFLQACKTHGIPDPTEFIDRMLALDFIMTNADRHLNNFGFIRDADTLEWIGPAPIFDSGGSLWHTDHAAIIGLQTISKTFDTKHEKQIKLASTLEWVDLDALENVHNIISEILPDWQDPNGKGRKEAIVKATEKQIYKMEKLIKQWHPDKAKIWLKAGKNNSKRANNR
jgi:hypothetical protein